MTKTRIVNIVGTRPNLIKMAPIMWEMKRGASSIEPLLVHTGQHYDPELSDIFFRQLDIPTPDYHLEVGSGSHSTQTGQIMIRLEELLESLKPKMILVVGDVNSTMAAALVAAKMQIPLAHVEAGLRSFDRTMPEEINRVVTDGLSNLLFITEESGTWNLKKEGVETFLDEGNPIYEIDVRIVTELSNIFDRSSLIANHSLPRLGAYVGNVMIDTLLAMKGKAEREANIQVPERDYALMTLHRPSNVDVREMLAGILTALNQISEKIPILFPCHPRTRQRITGFGLEGFFKPVENRISLSSLDSSICLLEPLGYLEFLKLMGNAKLVLTDSGGIQEETTILGVPCFTLRENTERPVTLTDGTNTLVGTDPEKIIGEVSNALNGKSKKGTRPVLWDGKAAERIIQILLKVFQE